MDELGNPTPNEQSQEGQPQPLDLSGLVKDGKILGKYEDATAAEAGYWNAVTEMNKSKDQLNMALQVIDAYQRGTPQQQAQTTTPSYETNLDKLGIPVPDVVALVKAQARMVAQELLHEQLSPLVQGASARSEMANLFPDFATSESEIMKHTKANPALAKSFNALLEKGQPLEALQLGYFHWKSTSAPKSDAATEAARRAAAGPANTGGVNRTSGLPQGPSQGQLDEAMSAYHSGDARPLFDLKFKNMPLTYSEQMEALMRGK
jgi:hypothetical protein